MSDHSVIVSFAYGQVDLDPMFEIEDRLIAAIEEAEVGEFDGNEVVVNGSDGSFYMFAPDGDALLEVIRPVLESAEAISDVVASIRYGGVDEEDVEERRVRIK